MTTDRPHACMLASTCTHAHTRADLHPGNIMVRMLDTVTGRVLPAPQPGAPAPTALAEERLRAQIVLLVGGRGARGDVGRACAHACACVCVGLACRLSNAP
jgi:hypothetical protein